MNLSIKKLSDTDFSMYDVHACIKEVYRKRAEEGIHFVALYKSTEEIEEKIKKYSGIVLIAIDTQKNEIIGTGTILFDVDKRQQLYGICTMAAIKPEYQGLGIGTKLRIAREECARERGCTYISSSTSEKATSSIKYHLKNGARKYSFISAKGSDFYSIVFRKYLVKTYKNNYLYCQTRYLIFKLITPILRFQNGEYTFIGKTIHKITH